MNRSLFSSLLSFAALAACSSGSVTNGVSDSVTGTVAGSTFSVASARALYGGGSNVTPCPLADAGSSSCLVAIVSIQLGSREEAICATAATAASNTIQRFASASDLGFSLVKVNAQVTAGTYDIAPPPGDSAVGVTPEGSTAGFSTTTSTCGEALNISATSGTVTLSEVSATRITGTYSVTFGDQGAFAGSFDVPICVPTPATMATNIPPTIVCI